MKNCFCISLTVVLKWFHGSFKMVSKWFHSGFTVVLKWFSFAELLLRAWFTVVVFIDGYLLFRPEPWRRQSYLVIGLFGDFLFHLKPSETI